MSSSGGPRWGAVNEAAAEWGEPRSTVRRWAAQGRIPARRIGRKYQVDLNALDRTREPARPARWLTEQDKRLAREVAAALLPLADWQREKLSLLLHPGRGRHDVA
jgi:excisionase family DNA binding protein